MVCSDNADIVLLLNLQRRILLDTIYRKETVCLTEGTTKNSFTKKFILFQVIKLFVYSVKSRTAEPQERRDPWSGL